MDGRLNWPGSTSRDKDCAGGKGVLYVEPLMPDKPVCGANVRRSGRPLSLGLALAINERMCCDRLRRRPVLLESVDIDKFTIKLGFISI